MSQLGIVGGMPRKRRGPREGPLERVNFEVYPDEHAIVRRAKAAAALRGLTFREWLVDALDQQAARDGLPVPPDLS